jgi:hypothetical protein
VFRVSSLQAFCVLDVLTPWELSGDYLASVCLSLFLSFLSFLAVHAAEIVVSQCPDEARRRGAHLHFVSLEGMNPAGSPFDSGLGLMDVAISFFFLSFFWVCIPFSLKFFL